MTLLPPYSTNVWRAILVSAGLLFVIGAVFLFSDRCSTFNFNRGLKKEKEKIANTIGEISNIKEQQANLALQEAEKRGELARDQETLANAVYGQDEAKKEVNAALANYNKALAANSNTNATAKDIEDALKRLQDTP